MNNNGYDSEYDRDEYNATSHEHHRTRWKVRGDILVTVPQDDPRTGEGSYVPLWIPFGWTRLDVTPDDTKKEVIENLLKNLDPEIKTILDRFFGIDLEGWGIEDLYIDWEADD